VTGRRERRRKKQQDNLIVKTAYGELKEKAVDRTVRRARCGSVCRPCRKTDICMCMCMCLSVDNFGLRKCGTVHLYQDTGGQAEMNNYKFINSLGPLLSHMVINTVRKSSCIRRNYV